MLYFALMMVPIISVDTTPLTDAITDALNQLFPWVGIAIAILAPIVVIGLGFKFGGQLLAKLGSFLKLG